MKEVTRIHLAKTPYDIEVDARKKLQRYLADIEKTLQADEDTMIEIEARMVELLAEAGVTRDKVITGGDVENIKQKLGEPDEFIDADSATPVSGEKRLMRDTSEGMLGGVLAGIAAYYSINVMWLRLAAIVLAILSFGTAFIIYLILWIIMPATKTVADKLQLYGQKVTPGEIKRHIDEFTAESTRHKPFVVVLRCLLAMAWLGAIVLTIGVLVFGFALNTSDFHQIQNEPLSSWLMTAGALIFVSGILFVIFCSILAYASAAWKMNKRILTSIIILMIAGILTFSCAIAGLVYRNYTLDQMVIENTHTKVMTVGNKLDKATSLVVEGSDATITYIVSDEKSMEVSTVGSEANRDVQLESHKGSIMVSVGERLKNCETMGRFCSNDSTLITIHGPALTAVTTKGQINVEYVAKAQEKLVLHADRDSQVTVSEGSITSVESTSNRASSIDLTGASIGNVITHTSDSTSLRLGNIDTLTILGSNTCSSGGESTIEVESTNSARYNDKEINPSTLDNACLEIITSDEL